jgi:hypothetical protein
MLAEEIIFLSEKWGITANGLQLPVVGVWNTQRSIAANGFLKIQNFLLPRPRQLLVGAVSGSLFASFVLSLKKVRIFCKLEHLFYFC